MDSLISVALMFLSNSKIFFSRSSTPESVAYLEGLVALSGLGLTKIATGVGGEREITGLPGKDRDLKSAAATKKTTKIIKTIKANIKALLPFKNSKTG